MPSVRIDPQAWLAGVRDAYAGRPNAAAPDDDHSYHSGRVEGEALRQKHREEYERLLFTGLQTRPLPPPEPSHG